MDTFELEKVQFIIPPIYREIGGGQRSKSLAKKLDISVLSDLTLFRPPMFSVGGTRR